MDIILHTIRTIAFALKQWYFLIFLIILAFILFRQNRKTAVMQKMIMGESVNSALELTISQIVMGIFAGVIASIMLTSFGVAFYENSMIEILFLISILLMTWKSKYMCFSYSGAILGGISIINLIMAKYYNMNILPQFKFNITSLMTMVAVLHFVEGLLVILDGKRGAIPIFAKRDDKVIGGFVMKRYWALPIAIIMLYKISSLGGEILQTTPTPSWWPILNGTVSLETIKDSVLILIPFFGVLGYNSITFTKNKSVKAANSGLFIIGYSVLLFILAQMASINIFFKILVVIFAPVGHNIMLNMQRNMEFQNKPKYISNDEGLMVLDLTPNSFAYELGIRSGDSIMQINDENIESDLEAIDMLTRIQNNIKIKFKKQNGKIKEVTYDHKDRKLGLVFVPKTIPGDKDKRMMKFTHQTFSEVLNNIKKKNKDGDK